MFKGEYFKFWAYLAMIAVTGISTVAHINPMFMVIIHTSLLVYIGSVNSCKNYDMAMKQNNAVETMKQKDAWLFPVFGSGVLLGLFLLLKYFNKDYVNLLFHIYFTFLGAYSFAALLYEKLLEHSLSQELAKIELFKVPPIPWITEKECTVDVLDIISWIIGASVGIVYYIIKNWILNNIIGCTFSIFGIENLLLGQYKVGFILLSLLFFYDIFWVFFTEVMVSVAKNLEGPIKLLFPKKLDWVDSVKDFNMIGLGDIVIPGIYVAMMLRFDLSKCINANPGKKEISFSFGNCKYFVVTLIGYFMGILSTLFCMWFFGRSQPALLYIVPWCLITSILLSVIRGEFSVLWNFSDDVVIEEMKKIKAD